MLPLCCLAIYQSETYMEREIKATTKAFGKMDKKRV